MGGTPSLVLLAACSRALQPDVLLLIADDVGFNGVGYQSDYTNVSSGFLTPRLDALAAESLKLSSFYVLPLCAPTRAALLTGRYPTRYGLSAFNADWGKPWGLPASETLLPEVLKAANYTTGLLGKWHLGSHRDAALPQSRGFDVFRGFYSGGLTHFTHDTGVASGVACLRRLVHGTGRLLPSGNIVATSASSRDFGQQGVRARPAKRCRAAPPRPVAARWSVDPFARPRRPPVGAA